MKKVLALNTVSGQVAEVPEAYMTHPVLGKTLVAVPDETKPYNPEFYKPTDSAGYEERRRTRKSAKMEPTPEEAEEPTPEPENL